MIKEIITMLWDRDSINAEGVAYLLGLDELEYEQAKVVIEAYVPFISLQAELMTYIEGKSQ